MGFTIGVDIGGTFTDCVVLSDGEVVATGKTPSSAPAFQEGFIASVTAAAATLDRDASDLLSDTDAILHGSTVGTNALVEGRYPPVGLITTKGHRHTLMFMHAGGRLLNQPAEAIAHIAAQSKPDPLVPLELTEELDERVTSDGRVLVELRRASAEAAVRALAERGVESFAVALLWSMLHPAHERLIGQVIEELLPGAFVSLSSEVVPRAGEYSRTVATVVNAAIGPVMRAYLRDLETALRDRGYGGTLEIMSCAGGLLSLEHATELPLLTVGSGPVGGIIGAAALGEEAGAAAKQGSPGANILTADMGGTTFDVGVIRGGKPLPTNSTWHGEYEYFVPTLDIRSIGAGGGSVIAFHEQTGTLRVGPRSAGAYPGPVCYGRGGEEPTVTDADLVLGLLNPDYFLGGKLTLDVGAAREALERVGAPLGLDAENTAAAAVRITDNQMADAIRMASVQQGFDPRDYTMLAYGGAGPVHATALARQLRVSRVVVPLSDLASEWSAFGIASAEPLVVAELPVTLEAPLDVDVLNGVWNELEDRLHERLTSHGYPGRQIVAERYIDLHFSLQTHELEIRAADRDHDAADADALVERFAQQYEQVYGEGTGYADAGVLASAVRVRARVAHEAAPLRARVNGPDEAGSTGLPAKGTRRVLWYGSEGNIGSEVQIVDGERLRAGVEVNGPSVIELPDTAVVVWAGQTATIDGLGSIVIDTETEGGASA
jgi:N-methylhydantoinase A